MGKYPKCDCNVVRVENCDSWLSVDLGYETGLISQDIEGLIPIKIRNNNEFAQALGNPFSS